MTFKYRIVIEKLREAKSMQEAMDCERLLLDQHGDDYQIRVEEIVPDGHLGSFVRETS
jgi:hypothetical protein